MRKRRLEGGFVPAAGTPCPIADIAQTTWDLDQAKCTAIRIAPALVAFERGVGRNRAISGLSFFRLPSNRASGRPQRVQPSEALMAQSPNERAPSAPNDLGTVRRAAEELLAGNYDLATVLREDTQSEVSDELRQLRSTLLELGRTIERRFGESQRLYEITEQINRGVTVDEVLNSIYESFRSVIPYDRIGFAQIVGQGRALEAVWARTESAQPQIGRGYKAPLSASLREVLEQNSPRVINDLEAYGASHPESDSCRRMLAEGIRASLTCPLQVELRPIGFLFFSSSVAGTYRELHQHVFRQIAGQVAGIVDKSQVYQQLIDTQERLSAVNTQLERLASLDGLTGVPNRRAFDLALEEEWRRATRSLAPLSLLMIDIDYFKRFNDANGHQAGDACLKQVAHVLSAPLQRAGDLVARYGGEEFAVILPSTPAEGARHIAERVRQAVKGLELPHPASPVSPHVTISVGISTSIATRQRSAQSLLASADHALYRAKDNGRNKTYFAAYEQGPPSPQPSAVGEKPPATHA